MHLPLSPSRRYGKVSLRTGERRPRILPLILPGARKVRPHPPAPHNATDGGRATVGTVGVPRGHVQHDTASCAGGPSHPHLGLLRPVRMVRHRPSPLLFMAR